LNIKHKLVYSISRSIWRAELIQFYAVANMLAITAVRAKANEEFVLVYIE
jgi:hypothetical protein